MKRIGKNIEKMRTARGLTRKGLAKAAHVSCSRLETHEKEGLDSVDALRRYAVALGCTMDELAGKDPDISGYRMRRDITNVYPYNLAVAVLLPDLDPACDDRSAALQAAYRVYVPGLLSEVEALSRAQVKVVEMHFEDGYSLARIGRDMDLTRERIRQILCGALRKLGTPKSKRMWITQDPRKVTAIVKERDALLEENAQLRERVYTPENECSMMRPLLPPRPDIPVEELGLPARAEHCLLRTGIRSLAQLRENSVEQLRHIRGMGVKSTDDICSVLAEYGIDLAPTAGADMRAL